MSAADIFDDIRRHAGAAGGKFMHENVVLAAVEEILTQQSLDRSAVSYMGALMLSLQSDAGKHSNLVPTVVTLSREMDIPGMDSDLSIDEYISQFIDEELAS